MPSERTSCASALCAAPLGKVMPSLVWPSLLVALASTCAYGWRGHQAGAALASARRSTTAAMPSDLTYPSAAESKDLQAPCSEQAVCAHRMSLHVAVKAPVKVKPKGAHIRGQHLQALEGDGCLRPQDVGGSAHKRIVNAARAQVAHRIVEGRERRGASCMAHDPAHARNRMLPKQALHQAAPVSTHLLGPRKSNHQDRRLANMDMEHPVCS